MHLAVHVSKICSSSMLQPLHSFMLDCLYSWMTAYFGLIRTLRAVLDHAVQLPIKQAMILPIAACMNAGRQERGHNANILQFAWFIMITGVLAMSFQLGTY